MSTVAFINRCVASGMPLEMALKAAEAFEAELKVEIDAILEPRRAKDRARKAAKPKPVPRNSAESADSAEAAERLPTCTRVVIPSLPSLRSEGKPPEKPSASTPKGANSARGTRLPDDWSPPEGLIAGDFGLTHEQYAQQADVFRDYWRAVPGAKGRKSDWPATWRNWLRRTAENSARKAPHERPDADPKFTARQANYARAFAGAEQASRQRWKP